MLDEAKGPSATKQDQNPKGGLSAKGRKKFGVKAGVKSYSSASEPDKRRWVRWALRFTKTPRPLKKPNGEPTRYALMLAAWGEPVPSSAAAVRAVHSKAVARAKQLKMGQYASDGASDTRPSLELVGCHECPRQFIADDALFTHMDAHLIEAEGVASEPDGAKAFSAKEREKLAGKGQAQKDGSYPIRNAADLRNAIQAYGRSSNKAATKAHIIKRAKALGLVKLLPEGWDMAVLHTCEDEGCERAFLSPELLAEHASAVHSFAEIESLVRSALKAKFLPAAPLAPNTPSAYLWVEQITTDEVVFEVEMSGKPASSYMIAYSVGDDDQVSFSGEPVPVRRRTVYEPIPKSTTSN